MLEEMKEKHTKDTETIHERISAVQKKVDANAKFVVGAGAVLATVVTVLQVLPPVLKVLTPQLSTSMIGGTHVERSDEFHRQSIYRSDFCKTSKVQSEERRSLYLPMPLLW